MRIGPYGAGKNSDVRFASQYIVSPIHSRTAWSVKPSPPEADTEGQSRSEFPFVVQSTGHASTSKSAFRNAPMARGMCAAEVIRSHFSPGCGLIVALLKRAFSAVSRERFSTRVRLGIPMRLSNSCAASSSFSETSWKQTAVSAGKHDPQGWIVTS
jgi:hypothetical protein